MQRGRGWGILAAPFVFDPMSMMPADVAERVDTIRREANHDHAPPELTDRRKVLAIAYAWGAWEASMKRLVVVGLVGLGLSSSALAGPPTPKERAGNRQAVREDRREVRNDRWDVARLTKVLNDYRAAAKSNAAKRLAGIEERFLAELNLELAESRVEVREKQAEVNDSRQERNGERREVVRDVVDGRPVQAARGAHELVDDRRDLADDRRDRNIEVRNLEAKRDIRTRFTTLKGQTGRESVDQKIKLIEDALKLARDEVGTSVQERIEDKREIREDRPGIRPPK
jgi:hypothetical protein